jgi:predicted RNA-binding protein with PUA domain
MEYDLKAMDLEIKTIEEGAKRLKELGPGFEAVEKNAEAILAFTYILRKNISDIIE